jgi:hypothetical protein
VQAVPVAVDEVAAERVVEFRGRDALQLIAQREVALLGHCAVEALDAAVLPRATRRVLAPVQVQLARQGVEFVHELRSAVNLQGVDAEGGVLAELAQEARGAMGVQPGGDAGEDEAPVSVDRGVLAALARHQRQDDDIQPPPLMLLHPRTPLGTRSSCDTLGMVFKKCRPPTV